MITQKCRYIKYYFVIVLLLGSLHQCIGGQIIQYSIFISDDIGYLS